MDKEKNVRSIMQSIIRHYHERYIDEYRLCHSKGCGLKSCQSWGQERGRKDKNIVWE